MSIILIIALGGSFAGLFAWARLWPLTLLLTIIAIWLAHRSSSKYRGERAKLVGLILSGINVGSWTYALLPLDPGLPWSEIVAVMIVLAVWGCIGGAWWVAGGAMAEWQGLKHSEGQRMLAATLVNFLGFDGWFKNEQIVNDGQLQGNGPIRRPGPGIVTINGESAVVFEREGKISQICGPGRVITQPGEMIRAAFDLRLQSRFINESREAIYSHDGVAIRAKFFAHYRIDGPRMIIVGGLSPKTEASVKLAVTVRDWHVQAEQVARAAIREVVSERRLDEILDLQRAQTESPWKDLEKEIQERANLEARMWGLRIERIILHEIRYPEEVEKRLVENWSMFR